MHPVLVGLDMPAADVFRDRLTECIHREGIGEPYDVAFAGCVVAVRDMEGLNHTTVEKSLEEDWRMRNPERIEPAAGVIPRQAEVFCRPNREAKEIAGQALVADAVDRSEIFGTTTGVSTKDGLSTWYVSSAHWWILSTWGGQSGLRLSTWRPRSFMSGVPD